MGCKSLTHEWGKGCKEGYTKERKGSRGLDGGIGKGWDARDVIGMKRKWR